MPAQSIFKSADSPKVAPTDCWEIKLIGTGRAPAFIFLTSSLADSTVKFPDICASPCVISSRTIGGEMGRPAKKNPHGPFYIVSRNLRKKLSTFVIELQTYNRLKRSIRSIKRRFFNIPSGQSCRRKRV